MKKFEILSHTADIKTRVYGDTLKTLFENSAEVLYFLIGTKYLAESEEETIEIKVSADTLEDLLVKFLNELIYYVEIKKKAGKIFIKRLNIEEGKTLSVFTMKSKSIDNIKKEIKAATYHDLKIEKEGEMFSVSIIFDV